MDQDSEKYTSSEVLVTGGTGYVASHLLLYLIRTGLKVRTTVRTTSRANELRDTLINAGVNIQHLPDIYIAELTEDTNWAKTIEGCRYVYHVASPFPASEPNDEQELIRPAQEGALRVLRFARDAGVKRVVFTSSFAAIGFGNGDLPLFTEENWSVIDGASPLPAYYKSKTLAEKAAWKLLEAEGGELELAVVNPTGIFGPVLSPTLSSSVLLIQAMATGKMPECPKFSFGAVDVRDLVDLHVRAMTNPAANRQRFIGTSDEPAVSMLEIANMIRKYRPKYAQKVPSRESGGLDNAKNISNQKAKSVLAWEPRPIKECILDTVDSLEKNGLI